MLRNSTRGLTISAIASICLCGCHSIEKSKPVSQGDELLQARWPVHNFNGYDPYPIAESARITAFVDFGRADGLLRFSLGCGVYSMPYEITEKSRLKLPVGVQVIRPELNTQSCDEAAVRRNLELVDFIEATPSIRFEDDFMLTLRVGRQVLELNSVEYVLSN